MFVVLILYRQCTTGTVPAQTAIEPGRNPARSPLKIKSMNLI